MHPFTYIIIGTECIVDSRTVEDLCGFNFPANQTNTSVVVIVTNKTDEDYFVVNIDELSLATRVNRGDITEASITVVDSE